jgi:CRISPR type III-B/RAMP module-associated protein Cmr5
MSDHERLQSREQRIVGNLEEELPTDKERLKPLRARALDLPAMVRRHGLMQVLLFLLGKEKEDSQLARHLVRGIGAALDEAANEGPEPYAESLAAMDLPLYLLHTEAALETANWLKLLVVARLETEGIADPARA